MGVLGVREMRGEERDRGERGVLEERNRFVRKGNGVGKGRNGLGRGVKEEEWVSWKRGMGLVRKE